MKVKSVIYCLLSLISLSCYSQGATSSSFTFVTHASTLAGFKSKHKLGGGPTDIGLGFSVGYRREVKRIRFGISLESYRIDNQFVFQDRFYLEYVKGYTRFISLPVNLGYTILRREKFKVSIVYDFSPLNIKRDSYYKLKYRQAQDSFISGPSSGRIALFMSFGLDHSLKIFKKVDFNYGLRFNYIYDTQRERDLKYILDKYNFGIRMPIQVGLRIGFSYSIK
jgi:hypothetical protein